MLFNMWKLSRGRCVPSRLDKDAQAEMTPSAWNKRNDVALKSSRWMELWTLSLYNEKVCLSIEEH